MIAIGCDHGGYELKKEIEVYSPFYKSSNQESS